MLTNSASLLGFLIFFFFFLIWLTCLFCLLQNAFIYSEATAGCFVFALTLVWTSWGSNALWLQVEQSFGREAVEALKMKLHSIKKCLNKHANRVAVCRCIRSVLLISTFQNICSCGLLHITDLYQCPKSRFPFYLINDAYQHTQTHDLYA